MSFCERLVLVKMKLTSSFEVVQTLRGPFGSSLRSEAAELAREVSLVRDCRLLFPFRPRPPFSWLRKPSMPLGIKGWPSWDCWASSSRDDVFNSSSIARQRTPLHFLRTNKTSYGFKVVNIFLRYSCFC